MLYGARAGGKRNSDVISSLSPEDIIDRNPVVGVSHPKGNPKGKSVAGSGKAPSKEKASTSGGETTKGKSTTKGKAAPKKTPTPEGKID